MQAQLDAFVKRTDARTREQMRDIDQLRAILSERNVPQNNHTPCTSSPNDTNEISEQLKEGEARNQAEEGCSDMGLTRGLSGVKRVSRGIV